MLKLSKNGLFRKVYCDPFFFIAFGFGSGLMPKAPGTWGTLAAIPLYLMMRQTSWTVYFVSTVAAFVLGVWVCDRVTRILGVDDYSGIVWDEIVGYWLTMFLAPPGLIWVVIGFSLFRLFDIWKPQPICLVDRQLHGGIGIMLDDILAAIPAWVIIQVLFRVMGHIGV